jgi:hypothetical protein
MRRVLPPIGAAAIAGYLVVLFLFDPERHGGFLPCPFHWLTGLLCPGCGAQRALHDLMHGRVGEAFGHNAALVVALPLLGLQWGLHRLGWAAQPLAADNRVVLGWALAVVAWGVLRNLA